jgi:hypothetical protein
VGHLKAPQQSSLSVMLRYGLVLAIVKSPSAEYVIVTGLLFASQYAIAFTAAVTFAA